VRYFVNQISQCAVIFRPHRLHAVRTCGLWLCISWRSAVCVSACVSLAVTQGVKDRGQTDRPCYHESYRQLYLALANPNSDLDLWPWLGLGFCWPLCAFVNYIYLLIFKIIFTFNPWRAMVVTRTRANNQGQRSVGSKARVETHGGTRPIPANAVRN